MDYRIENFCRSIWLDIERREKKIGDRILQIKEQDIKGPINYFYQQLKELVRFGDMYILLYYFEPLRIDGYAITRGDFTLDTREIKHLKINGKKDIDAPVISNVAYPILTIPYFVGINIPQPYREYSILKNSEEFQKYLIKEKDFIEKKGYTLQGYRIILTELQEEIEEERMVIITALTGTLIIGVADEVYTREKIREEFFGFWERYNAAQNIDLTSLSQDEWTEIYSATSMASHKHDFSQNIINLLLSYREESPNYTELNKKREAAKRELKNIHKDLLHLTGETKYERESYPIIGLPCIRDKNFAKKPYETQALLENFLEKLSTEITYITPSDVDMAGEISNFINELGNLRAELRDYRTPRCLVKKLKEQNINVELKGGIEEKSELKFPPGKLFQSLLIIKKNGIEAGASSFNIEIFPNRLMLTQKATVFKFSLSTGDFKKACEQINEMNLDLIITTSKETKKPVFSSAGLEWENYSALPSLKCGANNTMFVIGWENIK